MNKTANTQTAIGLIEQGDPAADGRAFRRCLGQYPTGVTVVTTRNGDKLAGMAVNSFSAVSLDPPLVLWSIRRESKSAADFLEASHFAVNVLAANQVEASQLFGSSNPERFNLIAWSPGEHGSPLLDGAIAKLECRREMVYQGGDHLIVVGHVERYSRFEGDPLLFAQGQYAVAQNHPSLKVAAASPSEPIAERKEASLLKLLSAASQNMSSLFQEHRQALGVTAASARILNRLFESPCEFDELERATYLGQDAIEDALTDLIAQGHVVRNKEAPFELTAIGRRTSEALAARAAEFTAEKFRGIADADIATAKRVLFDLQQK
ncbi:flavin reductase family protein [Cupriavidus sp. UME77]|uniref:flavin reductase family protein n=1 Tax=Cupriavidus sp. UME77 TaxID=1862321 RepID=UPI00160442B3|nr:flavin reductase family protein [Cupriavidus sp. UME77]MBB1633697.1 hypothetical protein [Cupriavidus sp. UME77]